MEDDPEPASMRVFTGHRGGLEFKHTPAAGCAGLKNEKWVVHRQIIVIVF